MELKGFHQINFGNLIANAHLNFRHRQRQQIPLFWSCTRVVVTVPSAFELSAIECQKHSGHSLVHG